MTMKFAASATLLTTALVLFGGPSSAFTTTSLTSFSIHCRSASASSVILSAVTGESNIDDSHDDDASFMTPFSSSMFSRRSILSSAVAITASSSLLSYPIYPASAAADSVSGTVVVAGATGQTGKRILDRLLSTSASSAKIIAGVRNVDKAMNALSASNPTVKDALAIKAVEFRSLDGEFSIIDTNSLLHLMQYHEHTFISYRAQTQTTFHSFTHSFFTHQRNKFTVANDSVESLASTLSSATSLIIAIGFVPSNPLQMAKAAHEVDNLGTIKLIDAAKASGTINKIVLITSILTNGRGWGQEKSPGFVMTNAFGNILDEKLVAENYLRNSGIDYTIVRPGGLSSKPPLGKLVVKKEDTLNSGEISRDTVANVCVAALTDKRVSNTVLEIYEDDTADVTEFNGLQL
jgi:nucleoside-diphosphate-sugar epimerase